MGTERILFLCDYTANLEFDPNDNILVGRVLDIDDIIIFHGESLAEFTRAFHEAVDDSLLLAKSWADARKTRFRTHDAAR